MRDGLLMEDSEVKAISWVFPRRPRQSLSTGSMRDIITRDNNNKQGPSNLREGI